MLSLCGKEAKFFYLPQRHQDAKLISVISFKGFCFEVVCHTELVSVSNENRKFKPYRHISWIVGKGASLEIETYKSQVKRAK